MILAAVVAAAVVPVGLALTVEPSKEKTSALPKTVPPIPSAVVAVSGTSFRHSSADPVFPVLPDAAKLFGMGAVLFGLAAGVKRTFPGHSRALIATSEAYNRDVSAR